MKLSLSHPLLGLHRPLAGLFPTRVLSRSRHRSRREPAPELEDMQRVAAVVANSPRARASLAFLGDKSFLFSASGDSLLMHRRAYGCSVALGSPLGASQEQAELVRSFLEQARCRSLTPVFYMLVEDELAACREVGLACQKVGEEAVVDLTAFSLEGSHRRRLRQKLRRFERAGGSVEVIPPEGVQPLLPVLRSISAQWLSAKRAREKTFSLGCFDESFIARFPVAVAKVHDEPVAFVSAWQGCRGGELAVDLMRHVHGAPHGTMECAFTRLFEWGAAEGYRSCSLGMAPLSGLEQDAGTSAVSWAATHVYRHGERLYNFRGLREFKDGFRPEWEARYLAAPGGMRLTWSLLATCFLIAGGLRGLLSP